MTAIEMCLNCNKKKCTGTCEPIRQAERDEFRNRKLTVDGETHTLAEWVQITGLSYNCITKRIYKGKKGRDVIKPKKKRRTDNGQLQTNSRG